MKQRNTNMITNPPPSPDRLLRANKTGQNRKRHLIDPINYFVFKSFHMDSDGQIVNHDISLSMMALYFFTIGWDGQSSPPESVSWLKCRHKVLPSLTALREVSGLDCIWWAGIYAVHIYLVQYLSLRSDSITFFLNWMLHSWLETVPTHQKMITLPEILASTKKRLYRKTSVQEKIHDLIFALLLVAKMLKMATIGECPAGSQTLYWTILG